MVSFGWAGWSSQLSAGGKNFNVAIFSDTINMINVKLFMMVVLICCAPTILAVKR